MSKQYKLKFKPTPISRLRKWKVPVPMKGDPEWMDVSKNWYQEDYWKAREEAVYYAMCPAAAWRKNIGELVDAGAEEYNKIMEEREKWKPTS
jgi:hypothetical protein